MYVLAHRAARCLGAVAVIACLAGCGGSAPGPTPPAAATDPPAVTSTVSPTATPTTTPTATTIPTATTTPTATAASTGRPKTRPGPTLTPASEKDVITGRFRAYYRALSARDFETACRMQAPETTARLLEKISTATGSPVTSCTKALAVAYSNPQAASVVDSIVASYRISDVRVDGTNASVTWSTDALGAATAVTSKLRQIGGAWQLVDTR